MRVTLAGSTPIGPTALEHELTFVTHNTREFECVEGLAVEDWLAYHPAGRNEARYGVVWDAVRARRAQSVVAGVRHRLFARDVCVRDWEPVNAAPNIVALGGSKLYRDEPSIALRELLQNTRDAVRRLRDYEIHMLGRV